MQNNELVITLPNIEHCEIVRGLLEVHLGMSLEEFIEITLEDARESQERAREELERESMLSSWEWSVRHGAIIPIENEPGLFITRDAKGDIVAVRPPPGV